jgi:hypothetical protein
VGAVPYDTSIPGQVSEFELRAIEAVAALVPPDGQVVEVGALMGRSSIAWARSLAPGATLTCIDPWEGNVKLTGPLGEVRNTPETFARHTAGLTNIRPIQGYSPQDVRSWSAPLDVVFEDSVHRNPVLAENIAFWVPKLKPSGAFCGHDYRPRFPDVVAEADALARRMGRELLLADTFWCLLPSAAANPRAPAVAARLRAIAADLAAKQARTPYPLRLVWRDTPQAVARGGVLPVVVRLTNTSPEPWRDPSGTPLRALARLRPQHAVGKEAREVAIGELPPDIVVPCRSELPGSAFRAGANAVVLELSLLDAAGRVAHRMEKSWPVQVG